MEEVHLIDDQDIDLDRLIEMTPDCQCDQRIQINLLKEYDVFNARKISSNQLSLISVAPREARYKQNFLKEITYVVEFLQNYNKEVHKLSRSYPHSAPLMNFLVQYVVLEMEMMSILETPLEEVEKRVLGLLIYMFSSVKNQKYIVLKILSNANEILKKEYFSNYIKPLKQELDRLVEDSKCFTLDPPYSASSIWCKTDLKPFVEEYGTDYEETDNEEDVFNNIKCQSREQPKKKVYTKRKNRRRRARSESENEVEEVVIIPQVISVSDDEDVAMDVDQPNTSTKGNVKVKALVHESMDTNEQASSDNLPLPDISSVETTVCNDASTSTVIPNTKPANYDLVKTIENISGDANAMQIDLPSKTDQPVSHSSAKLKKPNIEVLQPKTVDTQNSVKNLREEPAKSMKNNEISSNFNRLQNVTKPNVDANAASQHKVTTEAAMQNKSMTVIKQNYNKETTETITKMTNEKVDTVKATAHLATRQKKEDNNKQDNIMSKSNPILATIPEVFENNDLIQPMADAGSAKKMMKFNIASIKLPEELIQNNQEINDTLMIEKPDANFKPLLINNENTSVPKETANVSKENTDFVKSSPRSMTRNTDQQENIKKRRTERVEHIKTSYHSATIRMEQEIVEKSDDNTNECSFRKETVSPAENLPEEIKKSDGQEETVKQIIKDKVDVVKATPINNTLMTEKSDLLNKCSFRKETVNLAENLPQAIKKTDGKQEIINEKVEVAKVTSNLATIENKPTMNDDNSVIEKPIINMNKSEPMIVDKEISNYNFREETVNLEKNLPEAIKKTDGKQESIREIRSEKVEVAKDTSNLATIENKPTMNDDNSVIEKPIINMNKSEPMIVDKEISNYNFREETVNLAKNLPEAIKKTDGKQESIREIRSEKVEVAKDTSNQPMIERKPTMNSIIEKPVINMNNSKPMIVDKQKSNFREETVNITKNLSETIKKTDGRQEVIKEIRNEKVEVANVTSNHVTIQKKPTINGNSMIEKPVINMNNSEPMIVDKEMSNYNFREETANLAKNLPEAIKKTDGKQESIREIRSEKVEVAKDTSNQPMIERKPTMNSIIEKPVINMNNSKPMIVDKQKSNFREETVNITKNLSETIKKTDGRQEVIKEIRNEKVEVANVTSNHVTIQKKPTINGNSMIEKPVNNMNKSKAMIVDEHKTNYNFREETVNIAKNLPETIKKTDGKQEIIKEINNEKVEVAKVTSNHVTIQKKPTINGNSMIENPVNNMNKSNPMKVDEQKTNYNFREEAVNIAKNLPETIKKTGGKQEIIKEITNENVEVGKVTFNLAKIEKKPTMIEKPVNNMNKSKAMIVDEQKTNYNFREETVNIAKNLPETIKKTDGKQEIIKEIKNEKVEVAKVTFNLAKIEKKPTMIEKPVNNMNKSKPMIVDEQKSNYNFREEAVNIAKNLPETIKKTGGKQEIIKEITNENVEVGKVTFNLAKIEKKPTTNGNSMIEKPVNNLNKSKPIIVDEQKTNYNFREEAVNITKNLPETIKKTDGKQEIIKEINNEKVEVAKVTFNLATIQKKPTMNDNSMIEKPVINMNNSEPMIVDKEMSNYNFREETANLAKNLPEAIKKTDGKQESIREIRSEKVEVAKDTSNQPMIERKPTMNSIIEKPVINMNNSKPMIVDKQKSNFREETVNITKSLPETIKKTDGTQEVIKEIRNEKVEVAKDTSNQPMIERKPSMIEKPVIDMNKSKPMIVDNQKAVNPEKNLQETIKKIDGKQEIINGIDNLMIKKPVNKEKIMVNIPRHVANIVFDSLNPMKMGVSEQEITKIMTREIIDVEKDTSLQSKIKEHEDSLIPMIPDNEESIKKITKEIANATFNISSQQTIKSAEVDDVVQPKKCNSEGMKKKEESSVNIPKIMVINELDISNNLPRIIMATPDKQENKLLGAEAKKTYAQGNVQIKQDIISKSLTERSVVNTFEPPPMVADKQKSINQMTKDVVNATVSQEIIHSKQKLDEVKTNIPTEATVKKQRYCTQKKSNLSKDKLKLIIKAVNVEQTNLSKDIPLPEIISDKQEASKIVNKNKPKETRNVGQDSLQSKLIVDEKQKVIKEIAKKSVIVANDSFQSSISDRKEAADINKKLTETITNNREETIINETLSENEDILLERQMNLQPNELKSTNRNESFKSIYLSKFDLQMTEAQNESGRKNEISTHKNVGEGNEIHANVDNANIITEEMNEEQELINANSVSESKPLDFRYDDGWLTANALDFGRNPRKFQMCGNSLRDYRNIGGKSMYRNGPDFNMHPSIKVNNRRESMESSSEFDTDDFQNYNDHYQNRTRHHSNYPQKMPHSTKQRHNSNHGILKKRSNYRNYNDNRQRQYRRYKPQRNRYSPNRSPFFANRNSQKFNKDKLRYTDDENPSTSYQNNTRVPSSPLSSDSYNEKFFDESSDPYVDSDDGNNMNRLYNRNKRNDNNYGKSNWFPKQDRRSDGRPPYQSGNQRGRYQEKTRVVHDTRDFKRASLKRDEPNFNNRALDFARNSSSPPPRELAYESNRFCIKHGEGSYSKDNKDNNKSDDILTNINKASAYIEKTLSPYTTAAYSNSSPRQVNKIQVCLRQYNSPEENLNIIDLPIIKQEIEPSSEVENINRDVQLQDMPLITDARDSINIPNNANEETTVPSKHIKVTKRKDIIKTSLILSEIIPEDSISNNSFNNDQSDENQLMNEVVCNMIKIRDNSAENVKTTVNECQKSNANQTCAGYLKSVVVKNENYKNIESVHENSVIEENNEIAQPVTTEIVDTNNYVESHNNENTDNSPKEIGGQVKSYQTMYPKIMEILSGPSIAENLETETNLNEERALQTILPMNNVFGTAIVQPTEYKVIDKSKQVSVCEIHENESKILPIVVPEISEEVSYKEAENNTRLDVMEDVANKSVDEVTTTINNGAIAVSEDIKENEISTSYSAMKQSYHIISDDENDNLQTQLEDSSGSLTISLNDSISLGETSNDTDEKQNDQVLHESKSDVTGMLVIENIMSKSPEDEKMKDIRSQEEICEIEKPNENFELEHLDRNASSSDLTNIVESKSKSNVKNSKINENLDTAIARHKKNKRKNPKDEENFSEVLKTAESAQINQTDTGLSIECRSDEANLDRRCVPKNDAASPIVELFNGESLDSLNSTPTLQIDTSNEDSSNDPFLIEYVEPPAKKMTCRRSYDEDRCLEIDQHLWRDLEEAIYIEMMPEGEKRTSRRAAKTKAKARISSVKMKQFDDLLKILDDKSSQNFEKKETRGRKKVVKDEKVATTPKPKATSTPKSRAAATPKAKAQAIPKRKRTASPKPRRVATPTPRGVATPTPRRVATPTPRRVATPTPRRVATPTPRRVAKPTPRRVDTPSPRRVATPIPEAEALPQPMEATPKPRAGATTKPKAAATRKPKALTTPKPKAPRKPRKPKVQIGPKKPRGRPKKIKVIAPCASEVAISFNDEMKVATCSQEEPNLHTSYPNLQTSYQNLQEMQEECVTVIPRIPIVQQHSLNTLAAVACDMLVDFNEQSKYMKIQTPKFQSENDDSSDSYEGKLVISDEIKEDVVKPEMKPENIQCSVIREVKEAMLEKPQVVKPVCEPLIQPEIVPPVDCDVKKPTDHRIDVILGNISKDEVTGVFEPVVSKQDLPLRRSLRSKSTICENNIEPIIRRASADSHDRKSVDFTNLFKIYEAKSVLSKKRAHEATLQATNLLHEQQYGNVEVPNPNIRITENQTDRLHTIIAQPEEEEEEVQAVDLSCKEDVRERNNQRKSEYTTYNVAPNPSESIIINYKVDCDSNLSKERSISVDSRNISRNFARRPSISKETRGRDLLLNCHVKDNERKLIENLCRDESVSITRIDSEPTKYANEIQTNVIVQNKSIHKFQPEVCKDIIVHESVIVKTKDAVQNKEQISPKMRQQVLEPMAVLTPAPYPNQMKRRCSIEVEHLIKKLKVNPELAVDPVDMRKDKKTARTVYEKRKSINDVLVRLSSNNQEKLQMESKKMHVEDMAEITLIKLNPEPVVSADVSEVNKHEEPAVSTLFSHINKINKLSSNMDIPHVKKSKQTVINMDALHVKKPSEPVANMDVSHVRKFQETIMNMATSHDNKPKDAVTNMDASHVNNVQVPTTNMVAFHLKKPKEPIANMDVSHVRKLQEPIMNMTISHDNKSKNAVVNMDASHVNKVQVPITNMVAFHLKKPKEPVAHMDVSHVKKLQEPAMNMTILHDNKPKDAVINVDASHANKVQVPITNTAALHDKKPKEPDANMDVSHVKKLQEPVMNMAISHDNIPKDAAVNVDASHGNKVQVPITNMVAFHLKKPMEPVANMDVSHVRKLQEPILNKTISHDNKPKDVVVNVDASHVNKVQVPTTNMVAFHLKKPKDAVVNMDASHVNKVQVPITNMVALNVKKPKEPVTNMDVSHVKKLQEPIMNMATSHDNKPKDAVVNVDASHVNKIQVPITNMVALHVKKPKESVANMVVSHAKKLQKPAMNMTTSQDNKPKDDVSMDASHGKKVQVPITNMVALYVKKPNEPVANIDVSHVKKLQEPAMNMATSQDNKPKDAVVNMDALHGNKLQVPTTNMVDLLVKEPVANIDVSHVKKLQEPAMNMATSQGNKPKDALLNMDTSHVNKVQVPITNMVALHVKKSKESVANIDVSHVKKVQEPIKNNTISHDNKPKDDVINVDSSCVNNVQVPITNMVTLHVKEPVVNMDVSHVRKLQEPIKNNTISHDNKSKDAVINVDPSHANKVQVPITNMDTLHDKKPVVNMDVSDVRKLQEPVKNNTISHDNKPKDKVINMDASHVNNVQVPTTNMVTLHAKKPVVNMNVLHVRKLQEPINKTISYNKPKDAVIKVDASHVNKVQVPITNMDTLQFKKPVANMDVKHVRKLQELIKNKTISHDNKPKDAVINVDASHMSKEQVPITNKDTLQFKKPVANMDVKHVRKLQELIKNKTISDDNKPKDAVIKVDASHVNKVQVPITNMDTLQFKKPVANMDVKHVRKLQELIKNKTISHDNKPKDAVINVDASHMSKEQVPITNKDTLQFKKPVANMDVKHVRKLQELIKNKTISDDNKPKDAFINVVTSHMSKEQVPITNKDTLQFKKPVANMDVKHVRKLQELIKNKTISDDNKPKDAVINVVTSHMSKEQVPITNKDTLQFKKPVANMDVKHVRKLQELIKNKTISDDNKPKDAVINVVASHMSKEQVHITNKDTLQFKKPVANMDVKHVRKLQELIKNKTISHDNKPKDAVINVDASQVNKVQVPITNMVTLHIKEPVVNMDVSYVRKLQEPIKNKTISHDNKPKDAVINVDASHVNKVQVPITNIDTLHVKKPVANMDVKHVRKLQELIKNKTISHDNKPKDAVINVDASQVNKVQVPITNMVTLHIKEPVVNMDVSYVRKLQEPIKNKTISHDNKPKDAVINVDASHMSKEQVPITNMDTLQFKKPVANMDVKHVRKLQELIKNKTISHDNKPKDAVINVDASHMSKEQVPITNMDTLHVKKSVADMDVSHVRKLQEPIKNNTISHDNKPKDAVINVDASHVNKVQVPITNMDTLHVKKPVADMDVSHVRKLQEPIKNNTISHDNKPKDAVINVDASHVNKVQVPITNMDTLHVKKSVADMDVSHVRKLLEPIKNKTIPHDNKPKDAVINVDASHVNKVQVPITNMDTLHVKKPVANMDVSHVRKLQEPIKNKTIPHDNKPKDAVINVDSSHVNKVQVPTTNMDSLHVKKPVADMDVSHVRNLQAPIKNKTIPHDNKPKDTVINVDASQLNKVQVPITNMITFHLKEPVANMDVLNGRKLQGLVKNKSISHDNKPKDAVVNVDASHVNKVQVPITNMVTFHVKEPVGNTDVLHVRKLQEPVKNKIISHHNKPKDAIINVDASHVNKVQVPITNMDTLHVKKPVANMDVSHVRKLQEPIKNKTIPHDNKPKDAVINVDSSHVNKVQVPITNMDSLHVKKPVADMDVSHVRNLQAPIKNKTIPHDNKPKDTVINVDASQLNKVQVPITNMITFHLKEPVANMDVLNGRKLQGLVKNKSISHDNKPKDAVVNVDASHVNKVQVPITNMVTFHVKEPVANTDVLHVRKLQEPVKNKIISHHNKPKDAIINVDASHVNKVQVPITNMITFHVKEPVANTDVLHVRKLQGPVKNRTISFDNKPKNAIVNMNVPHVKKVPEPIINMPVLCENKAKVPAVNMDLSHVQKVHVSITNKVTLHVKKPMESVANVEVSHGRKLQEPIVNMAISHDNKPKDDIVNMDVPHVKKVPAPIINMPVLYENKPKVPHNMDVSHVQKVQVSVTNKIILHVKKPMETVANMDVSHVRKLQEPTMNIGISHDNKPKDAVVNLDASHVNKVQVPTNMAALHVKEPKEEPVANMDVSHRKQMKVSFTNRFALNVKKPNEPINNIAVSHDNKRKDPAINMDVKKPKETAVNMHKLHVRKLQQTVMSMAMSRNKKLKESIINMVGSKVIKPKEHVMNKEVLQVKNIEEPITNMAVLEDEKEQVTKIDISPVDAKKHAVETDISKKEPVISKDVSRITKVKDLIVKKKVFHVKKLKDLSSSVCKVIKVNGQVAPQDNKPKEDGNTNVNKVNNPKQPVLNTEVLFKEIECNKPESLDKEIKAIKQVAPLVDFNLPDISIVRNAIVIPPFNEETAKILSHIDKEDSYVPKSESKSSENEAVSLGPLMPNNSLREAESSSLNPSPSGSTDYQYPDQDNIYGYSDEYFIIAADDTENIICKPNSADNDGDYINNVPEVQNRVVVEPIDTEITDIVLKEKEVASLMSCNEMQSYFIPLPQPDAQLPAQVIENSVEKVQTNPVDDRQSRHEIGHNSRGDSEEGNQSCIHSKSQTKTTKDDEPQNQLVHVTSKTVLKSSTSSRNSTSPPPPTLQRERLSAVITDKDIEELVDCKLPEELSSSEVTIDDPFDDYSEANAIQIARANELFNYVQELDISKLPKPRSFHIGSNEYLSTFSTNKSAGNEETSSKAYYSPKSRSSSADSWMTMKEGYRVCSPEFGTETCFTRIDKSHTSRKSSYNNDKSRKRTAILVPPPETTSISTGTLKKSSTSSRDRSEPSVSGPVCSSNSASIPKVQPSTNNADTSSDTPRKRSYVEHSKTPAAASVPEVQPSTSATSSNTSPKRSCYERSKSPASASVPGVRPSTNNAATSSDTPPKRTCNELLKSPASASVPEVQASTSNGATSTDTPPKRSCYEHSKSAAFTSVPKVQPSTSNAATSINTPPKRSSYEHSKSPASASVPKVQPSTSNAATSTDTSPKRSCYEHSKSAAFTSVPKVQPSTSNAATSINTPPKRSCYEHSKPPASASVPEVQPSTNIVATSSDTSRKRSYVEHYKSPATASVPEVQPSTSNAVTSSDTLPKRSCYEHSKSPASATIPEVQPSASNAPTSSDTSRKRSYYEHSKCPASESVTTNNNRNTESSDYKPRKRTAMSSISNNCSAPVPDFQRESSNCIPHRRVFNPPKPSISSTCGPSTNYMHSMPLVDHTTRTTLTPQRHVPREEYSFGPSNPARRPRSRHALMSSMRNEQIDGMSNIRSGNPRIPIHPERTLPEKSDLQWLHKLSVAIPDLAKQPAVYFQSDTNDS